MYGQSLVIATADFRIHIPLDSLQTLVYVGDKQCWLQDGTNRT
jgi:hypothetical protein